MLGIAGGSPVNSHSSDLIEFTRILDFALESKIQAKSGGIMQLVAPVAQSAEKYGGIERRTFPTDNRYLVTDDSTSCNILLLSLISHLSSVLFVYSMPTCPVS